MKGKYQKPAVVVVQLQSRLSLLSASEEDVVNARQSGYSRDRDSRSGFSQD